ncbi:MAG: AAA family ATPase, partial [Acidobacteria bacterium]|nr:AAA family ATPase [Acidobacteriota bacterium]MDW7984580.1 ATP-binding protein [Acidobacteriota bacterium]
MDFTPWRVPPAELRVQISLEEYGPLETTAPIRAPVHVIQQSRAFEALRIGLEQTSPGFHIFVVGPAGTGRRTLTRQYVEQWARTRPTPPDLCYVYNFEDPDIPMALVLPTGRAAHLRDEMRQFRRAIQEQLPRIFESPDYEEFRQQVQRELNQKQQEAFERLQGRARALGFFIISTDAGLRPVPLWQGKPMTPDVFLSLPDSVRQELGKQEALVLQMIQEFLKEQRRLQREATERVRQREREMVQQFLQPYLFDLVEEYRDQPKVARWIEIIQQDFMNNLMEVIQAIQAVQQGVKTGTYLDRYDVNILVSHASRPGAPVVYETNPTFYNLFGRIERRAVEGFYVTDFTLIKPGSLHRANGGVLIIEALEMFKYPLVWDTLKRVLQHGELGIEDYGQQFSLIPLATLRPEPIQIQVKVILIGPAWLYQLLYLLDEDFGKLFKIRAEFQTTFEVRQGGVEDTVRFIGRVCHEEGLLPLNREALQEVLTYSSRLAGDREELSARFGEIADLVREASYWAQGEGRSVVDGEAIRKTLEQRRYRNNLLEERVQKLIDRDVLFVDTQGDRIGQVNGLAVYVIGGYEFGKPSRITASVGVGREGIINIERQVRLSGPIHDKGVLILSGYLKNVFARNKPLSLTASICFEQSYEGVEGDSASLA